MQVEIGITGDERGEGLVTQFVGILVAVVNAGAVVVAQVCYEPPWGGKMPPVPAASPVWR